jgi:hypothetical protein
MTGGNWGTLINASTTSLPRSTQLDQSTPNFANGLAITAPLFIQHFDNHTTWFCIIRDPSHSANASIIPDFADVPFSVGQISSVFRASLLPNLVGPLGQVLPNL